MDSSITGVFETPEHAARAKEDLLAAGFSEEDVSVAVESKAVVRHGLRGKVHSLLHPEGELDEVALLTVYGDASRLREAERVVQKYEPQFVHAN